MSRDSALQGELSTWLLKNDGNKKTASMLADIIWNSSLYLIEDDPENFIESLINELRNG